MFHFADKGRGDDRSGFGVLFDRSEHTAATSTTAADIGDVIRGLNAIGVSPRDLIAILQAIKASGALQADLEII